MLVCLQERVLEYILGVFLVLGDVLGQAEDLAFVAIHQLGESGGIAGTGAGNQPRLVRERRLCGGFRHRGPS